MKILIAGLGSIGRRHLRNLLDLGERDILLYRTHRATLPDDDLVGFPVETDLDMALSHQPQAVIVSNPTSLHLDVAIPAARAGCSLFLEKPVSHSMERIPELQTALHQGGGQAFVGYQFRFHPGLRQVERLLKTGAIGRPLSVRAHWGEYLPGWHPWEDYRLGYSAREDLGGGVVLTLSHPIDYLRWLFGEVQAVWSFTGQLSDLELHVEDMAEIGLRFSNGVLGSLHLDYVQRPPNHWLEIIGVAGTIRWDAADGAVRIFSSGSSEPSEWERYPASQNFERNHLFLAQMQHFLAVVNGAEKPACTLYDGIRALKVALAVHASQDQERLILV